MQRGWRARVLCTYTELAEYDLYRWGQDISTEFPDSTWDIETITDPDDAAARQLIKITLNWNMTNHSISDYPEFSTLKLRCGINFN